MKREKIILEPNIIIKTHIKKLWNQAIIEYLIQWKNLPIEDATWEYDLLIKKHPQLTNIEGNIGLNKRSILSPKYNPHLFSLY